MEGIFISVCANYIIKPRSCQAYFTSFSAEAYIAKAEVLKRYTCSEHVL